LRPPALWSWRESVPLPPTPGIAQEQFSKQSAALAAKSDSPALLVAEPSPDQSPGGSERQPPTPELAGLSGAVSDAVNSESAIPPLVPSATDHATSTSRAPRNERVSRRPEHTSRHAPAVPVAAAKKPIWRLHWQARAEDEWCLVACRRANGEWCFFGCRTWRAQPIFYNRLDDEVPWLQDADRGADELGRSPIPLNAPEPRGRAASSHFLIETAKVSGGFAGKQTFSVGEDVRARTARPPYSVSLIASRRPDR
jgi:hypothetical protein